MRKQRIRHFVFVAGVCPLALAACDSRDILAPSARSLSPRTYISEPQSLGDAYLAAPGNSAPATVSGLSWNSLQSFPDSAWIVVNVTGEVRSTFNQGPCDQRAVERPSWPCMEGDPFDGFGAGPWDGGTISLRAYYYGGGGDYSAVKLRSSGATGAVGLLFARGSGLLTGRYNMRALWAWDPFEGDGPYSYNIAGGYTVTATAVPSPFQVTESGADAAGVVTYTVEPLYGLQFTSPVNGWPAGATFWAFYPGDSLPDRPDLSWPGWQITECQFKLVCQWKPPVAGRMQVLAHLEEQSAYARSKRAQTPPDGCQYTPGPFGSVRASVTPNDCADAPRLQVVCDGNDRHRGALVDCAVSLTPSAAFTITRRLANSRHVTVDDTAQIAVAAGDVHHWSGTRVERTNVRIEATTINSSGATVRLSASTRFDVEPRDWQLYQITSADLKVIRDSVALANMHAVPPPWGATQLQPVMVDSAASIDSVSVGPNAGAMYLRSQPQFPAGEMAVINIHPAMFPPPSGQPWKNATWQTWYNDQDGHGKSSNFIAAFPHTWCRQSDIPLFVTETERHEGITLADSSHIGVANSALRRDRLDKRLEQWVSDATSRTEAWARALAAFLDWKNSTYQSLQDAFDGSDTVRTLNRIGCQTDNDLTSP